MQNILFSTNAIPTENGDNIRVLIYTTRVAATPIVVLINQLLADGSIVRTVEQFNADNAPFPADKTIALTEGLLLGIQVYTTTNSVRRGEVFCRVELQTGSLANADGLTPLTTGYLSGGNILNFPISQPESALSGEGASFSIVGADPALGADIEQDFDANAYTDLLAGEFTLIADGTVANRTVVVTIQSSGVVVAILNARTVQTAGQTRVYQLWFGENLPADTTTRFFIGLPAKLPPGQMSVFVTATNLQAGDNFNAPSFVVRQLIIPS